MPDKPMAEQIVDSIRVGEKEAAKHVGGSVPGGFVGDVAAGLTSIFNKITKTKAQDKALKGK